VISQIQLIKKDLTEEIFHSQVRNDNE